METLQEWVLNNYLPLVVEYSMDSAIQLYKTHVKFRLFVLVENNDKIKEALLAAAPLHRGQVTFITVSKDQDRVLTYLNSTSNDFPSAHLTTLPSSMNHYWKFDRNDFENPRLTLILSNGLCGRIATPSVLRCQCFQYRRIVQVFRLCWIDRLSINIKKIYFYIHHTNIHKKRL